MKIILAGLDAALLNAWSMFFEQEANVSIVEGDITQLACDAVVSPANAFGFMDGGLDYALSQRFGWQLQTQVQQHIKALAEGELLVGQALVIPTGDAIIPYLISAPTMRVPMNFNIPTSVNAYLAMKAVLIKAMQHEQVTSVAIPGLCTGAGRMPPETAARQMWYAYQEIVLNKKMDFTSFGEAQQYHLQLNPDAKLYNH